MQSVLLVLCAARAASAGRIASPAVRDVMTLSYDQVRRPIYKSAVQRYRKYEAHLGPLKQALGWH
jgi:hypothetical protein